MDIEVRRVESDDLASLRANQAKPELNLVDKHFEAAEAGQLVFAVALADSEPVGTVLLDLSADALVPELRNMYVYPQARRKGAGRALSQFVEQAAREAGYTAVYLAVDPNNEKAVGLYVSLEYHPTGEHIFVESPEIAQSDEPGSSHYAVYKKSLTVR